MKSDRSGFALALAAALLAATATAASPTGSLRLVASYCDTLTATTSRLAVLDVDVSTGNATVLGSVPIPSKAIYGCPFDFSPTPSTAGGGSDEMHLMVLDSFSYTVAVDLNNASIGAGVAPPDPFFKGFINSYEAGGDIIGFSPTVTQNGYCHDGCSAFGSMDAASGAYSLASNVPFKAVMDDTHAVRGGSVYVQASYDLRPQNEWCDPSSDAALCLIEIDAETGALGATTPTPDYTMYNVARPVGGSGGTSVLAFVEGFRAQCPSQEGSYAFATVDLTTANATLVACADPSVVIETAPWTSSFSLDNTLLAQANGNAETGELHLVIFDAATGAALVDSKLPGVPETLGAASKLVDIWAVEWVA